MWDHGNIVFNSSYKKLCNISNLNEVSQIQKRKNIAKMKSSK